MSPATAAPSLELLLRAVERQIARARSLAYRASTPNHVRSSCVVEDCAACMRAIKVADVLESVARARALGFSAPRSKHERLEITESDRAWFRAPIASAP